MKAEEKRKASSVGMMKETDERAAGDGGKDETKRMGSRRGG